VGKHATGSPRKDGSIARKRNLERHAVEMGGEKKWLKKGKK
jgi:hypothetical protein